MPPAAAAAGLSTMHHGSPSSAPAPPPRPARRAPAGLRSNAQNANEGRRSNTMSFIRPPGLKITTQMTTLEGPHRTSMNRIALLLLLFILAVPAAAQELDCNVTIDMEQLTSEARENLAEFVSQIRQYMNGYHWTKEGIEGDKIQCTIQIKILGSSAQNHYTAQAFIGSQRQIYRLGRNSAMLRILDDKWDFDYTRNQSLTHDEYRFDPLLSFLDFYGNVIIGYEFDSYKPDDGTQFFQKALEIVNKTRSVGN